MDGGADVEAMPGGLAEVVRHARREQPEGDEG